MAVYIRTTDFLITHGNGLKRPGSSNACFTPGKDDGRCAIRFSETVNASGLQRVSNTGEEIHARWKSSTRARNPVRCALVRSTGPGSTRFTSATARRIRLPSHPNSTTPLTIVHCCALGIIQGVRGQTETRTRLKFEPACTAPLFGATGGETVKKKPRLKWDRNVLCSALRIFF
jgi:hypothetical protein